MGFAAEKTDGIAARRRPNKTLRHGSCHTCNLSAFNHKTLGKTSGKTSGDHAGTAAIHRSDSASADCSKSTEFVKFSSQPSDQVAANSDTAVTNTSSAQIPASKSQLTAAVISCLAIGAVLGYNGSISVNRNPVVFAPVSTQGNTKSAEPLASEIPSNEASVSPVAPSPVETVPIVSVTSSDTNDLQSEYLEEIQWLTDQNNSLKLQVDVLNEEALTLNNELLQLELETVALRLKKEPPTETRIVYNFVDVPLGANPDFPVSSQGTQESARAASRQGLPLNSSQRGVDEYQYSEEQYQESEEEFFDSEDQYLESEQEYFDSEDQYLESEEAYFDSEDQYLDSEDEYFDPEYEYTDEYMDEYESELELMEAYNGGEPTGSELSYDPETGFYINRQYPDDETQFEPDGSDSMNYPPIATE